MGTTKSQMFCFRKRNRFKFAQSLWNFKNLEEKIQNERNEACNLEDVLKLYNGSKYELEYKIIDNFIKFTYSKMGKSELISLPI